MKPSDGLLGESDHERRRLLQAPPVPHATAPLLDPSVWEFVEVTRELGTTPHIAQNLARPGGSAIDARTTWRPGYAMSQHPTGRRHAT
jgi:hypothetical protein